MHFEEDSAVTECDHPQHNDPPALGFLRGLTAVLATILAIVSIPVVTLGFSADDGRSVTLGCTLAGLAGISTGISCGAYMSLLRGRNERELYLRLCQRFEGLDHRVDDLEAGEQHMAANVGRLADRIGTGQVNDLAPRRSG